MQVSNIHLEKTKQHTKMKLAPTEELQRCFVASRGSEVVPTTASRSTTVDMTEKW